MKYSSLLLLTLLFVLCGHRASGADTPSAPTSLVPNGSFEEGLANWSPFIPGESQDKNCRFTISQNSPHAGSSCGLMQADNFARFGLGSPAFPIHPGERYRISVWVRGDSDLQFQSGTPGILIRLTLAQNKKESPGGNLFLALNGEVTRKDPSTDPVPIPKQWTQMEAVVEAPANADSMGPVLFFWYAKGSLYVDDFTIEKVDASVPLTPLHVNTPAAAAPPPPAAPVVLTPTAPLFPTDAQITAVAALLPASPVGVGRPITDRAAWATAMQQPYFQKQLKDAATYATQPIPDVEAAAKAVAQNLRLVPYELRTKRLNAFVIAECAQDDGQYLPLIEAELRAILTERDWNTGYPNEIDLGAAARAWTVATADYWLGDKLKPETRQLIRDEMRKRIFNPYVAYIKAWSTSYPNETSKNYWGWERGAGNWNPVCTSGVLGAALTLLDSPQERAFYVQTAENSMVYYLKGQGDDGYCFEGVGYWGYGFGSYLCLAETLYDQTQGRINLFQGNKVRSFALFLTRMQMLPGVYAAWGDVWHLGNGSPEETMEMINARWGMGWTNLDPAKSTMFATHPVGDRLFGFGIFGFPLPQYGASLVAGAPATPEEATSGPLRYFFPDGSVLITRSQRPDAPDLGLAVKGGNNGHIHSHNDNGTYFVATKGVPLVIDPGMEIYTKDTFGPRRFESMMNNSYGHDVPYVGDTLQKGGKDALGQITGTSFTDDRDTLTMDLTTSYTVPSLIKVTRTYVLDRTKPLVEIIDMADFSQPTDYGSAMITGSKWVEKGPGSFLIYEKDAAVQATVTLEGDGQALVNHIEPVTAHAAGAGYKPMRLGFNLDKPVTHVVMHTLIVPVPAPPAP